MPSGGIRGRTIRDFQSNADVWSIVDSWAIQHGFSLVEQDQVSRTYQRGAGFWMNAPKLKITWTGSFYRLEAWVYTIPINRIFTLGLFPEETVIESGGLLNSIPRANAREKVNILLQMLGEPPIP